MSPAPTLYGSGRDRRTGDDTAVRPFLGGRLSLDFVNTTSSHRELAREDDLSPGYANLVTWAVAAGLESPDAIGTLLRLAHREPREAAAVRRRAVDLRTALATIAASSVNADPMDPDAIDTLDRETRAALTHRHLTSDGTGLEWQWDTGHALDRMLWLVVDDAVDLLTSELRARIRQCEAPECERYFLDTSRNASRRYCSSNGCGTIDRVRRFRARQRNEHA